MRPRHFLILLAAALAAMAPKCSSKDCQTLRENVERVCASGTPRACEAAREALALGCPAPEPTPTATPSPEPTPTPTPVPTPSPTPTPTPGPTPTPTPPAPEPTPTPVPGCEEKPAASSASVTVGTHGDDGLVFTLHPKGGAFGAARWSDLTYPSVTSWFAPPDAKGGIDCQEPKDECHAVLLYMGKDAKNPKLKKNQGGFTVTGESGTVFRIHYRGIELDQVETLKVGPGVPCPPEPQPTPTPGGPAPNPGWPGNIDANCPREGDDGLFRVRVDAAIDAAIKAGDVAFPWHQGEVELFGAGLPYFTLQGLAVGIYGTEELAVQNAGGSPFSENYDLLTAEGNRRSGYGAYRSTCRPATRSSAIPAPAPPPASRYPAPIVRIDIKNLAQPQPGHYVVDATALSCDGGHNADFPDGKGGLRQCWPACGPEGHHPEGCDEGLGATWTGVCEGDPWCNGGGNPWQFRSNKAGSKARVCAQGVCTEVVVR